MSNPTENPQDIYSYAIGLKKEGKDDYEIEQALLMKGIDQETAQKYVTTMNKALIRRNTEQAYRENEDSGDSGAAGWLIWIGILVLINALSYAFDWPFWIY